MDYNIKLSNGQVLKGLITSPGNHMKALIIMVHGHGEHILRYEHWAELFNRNSIGFTGVDLPGHGRSDGKRGHVRDEALLNEMIDVMIRESGKTFAGMPLFLYGHSLGGVIVLNYILKKNPEIRGAIVTSPALRLAFEPGKAKLALAKVMKTIMPGLIQPTGLPVEYLSQDKAVVEKYVKDPLVHGKISVGLFHSWMNSSSFILKHAPELKVPLLLLHGSKDNVCSPKGSNEFAGKASLVELKMWSDGYHELHNEPFKQEVFDYILAWINKILA